jgi:hypothetical protein
MTEMMMMPDAGLADRLLDVRYSVAVGQVESQALAGYDAAERSPLQRAAAGELVMSAPEARRLRRAWRDTIASYTAGISDDTLLDDLAAWIERCAKPPFNPAPVVEGLIADIERVTRERLGGLSEGERPRCAQCCGHGQLAATVHQAAYDAVRSFTRPRLTSATQQRRTSGRRVAHAHRPDRLAVRHWPGTVSSHGTTLAECGGRFAWLQWRHAAATDHRDPGDVRRAPRP